MKWYALSSVVPKLYSEKVVFLLRGKKRKDAAVALLENDIPFNVAFWQDNEPVQVYVLATTSYVNTDLFQIAVHILWFLT